MQKINCCKFIMNRKILIQILLAVHPPLFVTHIFIYSQGQQDRKKGIKCFIYTASISNCVCSDHSQKVSLIDKKDIYMHDTIKIHNFFLHQFNLCLPSSLVHLLTLLPSTNKRLNILYHMQQQTILQYETNKEKILGQFKLQKPQQVEVCNFWIEMVCFLVFIYRKELIIK